MCHRYGTAPQKCSITHEASESVVYPSVSIPTCFDACRSSKNAHDFALVSTAARVAEVRWEEFRERLDRFESLAKELKDELRGKMAQTKDKVVREVPQGRLADLGCPGCSTSGALEVVFGAVLERIGTIN